MGRITILKIVGKFLKPNLLYFARLLGHKYVVIKTLNHMFWDSYGADLLTF
jgi:hypothetical protein